MSLVAELLDLHIPKGHLYFAMAFSPLVEVLNLKARGRQTRPVHEPYIEQRGHESPG
jgi:predicted tellurium resistance membrane protein TerC